MKTIVIGDVHGCVAEARDLIRKCDYAHGDRIIFVGDLVDRGPDPRGVVDLAMQYESVLGNHEERMLKYWAKRNPKIGRPSQQALKFRSPEHERTYNSLEAKHFDWFATLPKFLRLPEYNAVIVHAGVVPNVPFEAQQDHILLHGQAMLPPTGHGYWRGDEKTWWMSRAPEGAKFWTDFWRGPERVIFGHSVLSAPLVTDFAVGIDTGCCFGRSLTAVVLPEWNIVTVPAREKYYDRGREWAYEIASGIRTVS